jgi:hypothetical protein
MGAVFSKKTGSIEPQKFNNFYDMVDYIATYYILTMDFESLQKLSDPKYCDQLVVITSDIVSKYFNELDVEYLEQRTKQGAEINDMTKDVVMFLTKDHLESLDIKNDRNKSIRKKRVCIGIAKFYVSIASIYAAIITTINPVYIYKDQNGEIVKKTWADKNNVPKSAEIKYDNICDERIEALKIGMDDSEESEESPDIKLEPNICNLNTDRGATFLSDEPGISELEQLYYDVYNFTTGKFDSMSPSAKTDYENDLKMFYRAFTDKDKEMTPDITKFSDIPLSSVSNMEGCSTGKFEPKCVAKNDKLFKAYADHIKQMMQNAKQRQQQLAGVLNNLFLPVVDPYTKEKKIRIHPKLTDAILKQQVKITRNIIVQLYVKCEEDFIEGAYLYEAIVETKICDTNENRSNYLSDLKKTILGDYKNQLLKPNPTPNISNFSSEQKSATESNLNLLPEESSITSELTPETPPIGNPIVNNELAPPIVNSIGSNELAPPIETPIVNNELAPPIGNPIVNNELTIEEPTNIPPVENNMNSFNTNTNTNTNNEYKPNLGLGVSPLFNQTPLPETTSLSSPFKNPLTTPILPNQNPLTTPILPNQNPLTTTTLPNSLPNQNLYQNQLTTPTLPNQNF